MEKELLIWPDWFSVLRTGTRVREIHSGYTLRPLNIVVTRYDQLVYDHSTIAYEVILIETVTTNECNQPGRLAASDLSAVLEIQDGTRDYPAHGY